MQKSKNDSFVDGASFPIAVEAAEKDVPIDLYDQNSADCSRH